MNQSGLGPGIAARLSDYYQRQIVWIEGANAALDAVLASPDPPDYDRWIEEDAQRAKRLGELTAEFAALKKEWDNGAGLNPAEREAVQRLAKRVEALAAEFDTRREAVTARLALTADELRGEAGILKRGRENARKYGTDEAPGGGIVDRRA